MTAGCRDRRRTMTAVGRLTPQGRYDPGQAAQVKPLVKTQVEPLMKPMGLGGLANRPARRQPIASDATLGKHWGTD
jgi:hypothetical protein